MVIDMNVSRIKNIEQVRSFLSGTLEVQFVIADGAARERDKTRYDFIAEVVRRFGYRCLGRADKSLILRYLQRPDWLQRRPGQALGQAGRYRSGAASGQALPDRKSVV